MKILQCIFIYIDPGTGSMLIQFLIAAVFGLILFFKRLKSKVIEFFNQLFKIKPDGDNSSK